jgi:hypothetical protein
MDQSVIDRWRELTREADHGHLTWTGERATDRRTPVLRIGTRTYPARRIAYRVRHGIDPRGQAKPDCGRPDCIAPAHQTDTTNNQPVHRPHRHYPSAEAKLAALTRPTEDGHLEWTLPGRPYLSFGGINLAPARVAFAAHYGREPVGHVRAGCGTTGCLRGEHLDDRPARVRLAAAMTALGV